MMSLTFGLFTQVSGSGPLGPLVFVYKTGFFPPLKQSENLDQSSNIGLDL